MVWYTPCIDLWPCQGNHHSSSPLAWPPSAKPVSQCLSSCLERYKKEIQTRNSPQLYRLLIILGLDFIVKKKGSGEPLLELLDCLRGLSKDFRTRTVHITCCDFISSVACCVSHGLDNHASLF